MQTLISWLERVASEAGDTPWGEEAKKRAESLKNPATADELVRIQRNLYTIDLLPPTLPGFKPKTPGDKPEAVLPGIPGGEKKSLGPLPVSPGDKPPEKPTEPEKPKDAKDQPKAPDAPKSPGDLPKAPDPKAKEPDPKGKPPEPAPKPPEKK